MYAKLFTSILNSSLWSADPPTRVLFVTMLAMADREGRIFASRSGLQYQARLGDDTFGRALDALAAPDLDSSDLMRNPENRGRRIEVAEGGWSVINYGYYRGLQDEDERRNGARERQQRHRELTKARAVTPSHTPSQNVTRRHVRHTSEAESESHQSQRERETRARPGQDEVRMFWTEAGLKGSADAFFDHFTANGWRTRTGPLKDWKAAARNWSRREASFGTQSRQNEAAVGKSATANVVFESPEEGEYARKRIAEGAPPAQIDAEILESRRTRAEKSA